MENHVNDGFGNLQTPLDLLRKLRHDLERMKADPLDTYAAFDFFVTAEHLVDWTIPDQRDKNRGGDRKALRASEPLLQVTSHIASGAKHFRATAAHHDSVDHADVRPQGAFDPRAFSPCAFSPSAFSMTGLHIKLEDGTLWHAYDLADQVLAYWVRSLGA